MAENNAAIFAKITINGMKECYLIKKTTCIKSKM